MAVPLLETKFFAPRRRAGVVSRARLTNLLDRGAQAKVTLISAPAGFGKSTLLADWLVDRPRVAWLSLDAGDDAAATFWTYVAGALRRVAPAIGEPDASAPVESTLATLVNEVHAAGADLVLILDDVHVIGSADIHEQLGFLVDHLPPNLHLIVATRADPPLPLARLRARGDLVEIRAADLRFTPDEAAAYLNGAMDLHLTERDVAALEGRTEGWIAALQLAALSMQGRADVSDFIKGFAGDDRYIVDYLAEEVLQRQPPRTRDFLLRTSILDRLTAPLVDAVTGADDGRATLDALDRGNLFLIPLDDRRRWYRYHHLFADVLRARLADEQPGIVADLHRRASEWFAANAEPAEAVEHALASGDAERAADLIELAMNFMRQTRQEGRAHRWFNALPADVYANRPVLSIDYVATFVQLGDLTGVDAMLRNAERWLDPAADRQHMIVLDQAEFRRLPGSLPLYVAAQARLRGDTDTALAYARQSYERSAPDDLVGRGSAAGFLGLELWSRGDLAGGQGPWSEAARNLEQSGHLSDVLGVSIALADISLAQGHLNEAFRVLEHGLQLGTPAGAPVRRGAADMHVGLSELVHERNDLDAALAHLRASDALGEAAGLPQNRYRRQVAAARIEQSRGDLDAALRHIDAADAVFNGDFFPNVRPVPAIRARLWIAQGRVEEALRWAREQGLGADDDLTYLREYEHVTLARALLATGDAAGPRLLDRLIEAADAGGRGRVLIELLTLRSVTQERGALASLERAVSLAAPERFVRTILDEGPRVDALLARLDVPYARDLRAAAGAPPPARPMGALVEPLSDRELDVLRLLAGDLDGPDIANELYVSLNTVRTHTKNIYAKLGVNSRRAAVRRAQELGLLPG
jgi:LuxR family maltose regulon positive regulatory protein